MYKEAESKENLGGLTRSNAPITAFVTNLGKYNEGGHDRKAAGCTCLKVLWTCFICHNGAAFRKRPAEGKLPVSYGAYQAKKD